MKNSFYSLNIEVLIETFPSILLDAQEPAVAVRLSS
jgi:hypothetical protein